MIPIVLWSKIRFLLLVMILSLSFSACGLFSGADTDKPVITLPPTLTLPPPVSPAGVTATFAGSLPRVSPTMTAANTSTPQTPPSPTPTPTPLVFAVIGDFGKAGEPEANVAALVTSWQPEFIITTGDNNLPKGSAKTIDDNIGQYYHEFIYPYLGEYGPGAEVNRFFPTLGNHDWDSDHAQAYLDYFELPGNERYYDFTWGPVHFFALDSDSREPDGVGRSSVQGQWLQQKLAESISPWNIVYFHHAPYSSGNHGGTDWMQWPFEAWGADLVFAGHDHVYERLLVDNLTYITLGASGNPNLYDFKTVVPGSQVRYNDAHGAVRVEVTDTSLTIAFITHTGEIIDTYTMTAPKAETEYDDSSVQAFPNPANYQWEMVADGLEQPVGIAFPNDGSGRIFIVQQRGTIRIIQDGQLLPDPFLDLSDRVLNGAELGLLGLAFHPNFAENGLFYVNFTAQDKYSYVVRYQVAADDPARADLASEKIVLRVQQPHQNHNGGHLAFGADGYLYIGFGDGGGAGDPDDNAQNLSTFLGKMLRVDVDSGNPYAIPPDNPFANSKDGLPEIWSWGLRNPWKYSFDRLTGDLYIGDVGQNQWEEINFLSAHAPGGANFGWDFLEGLHPFEDIPPQGIKFTYPIWEYDHSQGCSVTGGYVYRGSLPQWQGIYLYGDYCTGYIWGLLQDKDGLWQNTQLFQTGMNISAFGENSDGDIYLVNYQGSIYKLTPR